MIAFLLAGAFWLAAFALLGWAGVAIMAVVCVGGEILLLSIAQAQARADRATAVERLEGYGVADSSWNDRTAA